MADPLFGSSSPPELGEDTAHGSIFVSRPSTYILPTHLSLEELHEVENCLVHHGGKLTYDIAEAELVLGDISQKKRAALELRSRGVWTEEIPLASETEVKDPVATEMGPPRKRMRTEPPEAVGFSTEFEEEEDGPKVQVDPSKNFVGGTQMPADTMTVVKLGWLQSSIKAGQSLPLDPFVVYRGRKTVKPSDLSDANKPPGTKVQKSGQILQRAKEDAASRPPPTTSNRFLARRSKETHDGVPDSQRHPPTLYRQTTSEHDEAAPLPPPPDWVRDQVLYACMRSAPLHPPNEDFIAQLEKIRRIRILTLDEIGVRAYSTSIAALAAYPYVIKRPSEILTLPGCDVKIANIFAEFQQRGGSDHPDGDGSVSAADALDTDPALRVLNTFNEIWGVGAKTAREFYYHRGWRDLDDVIEHGWDSLSRVQQIGVKFYDEFLIGVSRAESEAIAATVNRHANLVRPEANNKIDCVIVGGYRRGKELSGDVDLILTHRDDAVTHNLVVDVVASLEAEGYITHTLALHLTTSHREQQTLPFRGGETGKHFDSLDKALVVWQDPHCDADSTMTHEEDESRRSTRNPNIHRRVDIIISPWRTVGCAVLGWSGSLTFQRDLRRYAKKAHAWKFDSSGVRERTSGGQVVDLEHGGETWLERERLVMEGLGVGWRPPEERCSR